MPTCPECKKEIDSLLNGIDGRTTYMVHKGPVEGDIDFTDEEFDPCGDEFYACPECGADICTTRGDAEEFLWGEG